MLQISEQNTEPTEIKNALKNTKFNNESTLNSNENVQLTQSNENRQLKVNDLRRLFDNQKLK